MAIHEIGTLGRWKSSAAFRYIEEALQDTPLNAGLSVSLSSIPGGKSAPMTPCPGTPATKHLVRGRKQQKYPDHPGPEQRWAVSIGRYRRTSHRVRKASWNLKLSDWDTWSGWHFSEKNVKASLAHAGSKIPAGIKQVQKVRICI